VITFVKDMQQWLRELAERAEGYEVPLLHCLRARGGCVWPRVAAREKVTDARSPARQGCRAGLCHGAGVSVAGGSEASGRGRVALPGAGRAASIDARGGEVAQDRVDHPRLGDERADPHFRNQLVATRLLDALMPLWF
jgi:hypothetical protein